MKAEGILSIGGFLRSSKSLLVLWDPTYVPSSRSVIDMMVAQVGNPHTHRCPQAVAVCSTTKVRRLWCIFEYAAFVKSHEGQDPAVVKIRPTFLGPCTLWIFFGSVVATRLQLQLIIDVRLAETCSLD